MTKNHGSIYYFLDFALILSTKAFNLSLNPRPRPAKIINKPTITPSVLSPVSGSVTVFPSAVLKDTVPLSFF